MSNKVAKLLKTIAKAYNKNFRELKKYYNSLNSIQRGQARDEYHKLEQQIKMQQRITKAKEKINAIS